MTLRLVKLYFYYPLLRHTEHTQFYTLNTHSTRTWIPALFWRPTHAGCALRSTG